MLALDLPDGALGGVLAWYSIIHIPQERLPETFAEFCRVLAPGGSGAAGVPGRRRVSAPDRGTRSPGLAGLSPAAAGPCRRAAGTGRAGGPCPAAA
ncbi:MAG: class I SAM-dependent methyltransferase [Streptosporangiaceae bacterium]